MTHTSIIKNRIELKKGEFSILQKISYHIISKIKYKSKTYKPFYQQSELSPKHKLLFTGVQKHRTLSNPQEIQNISLFIKQIQTTEPKSEISAKEPKDPPGESSLKINCNTNPKICYVFYKLNNN